MVRSIENKKAIIRRLYNDALSGRYNIKNLEGRAFGVVDWKCLSCANSFLQHKWCPTKVTSGACMYYSKLE